MPVECRFECSKKATKELHLTQLMVLHNITDHAHVECQMEEEHPRVGLQCATTEMRAVYGSLTPHPDIFNAYKIL